MTPSPPRRDVAVYRDWFILGLQVVCGAAGLALLILGLFGVGGTRFIVGGGFMIVMAFMGGALSALSVRLGARSSTFSARTHKRP